MNERFLIHLPAPDYGDPIIGRTLFFSTLLFFTSCIILIFIGGSTEAEVGGPVLGQTSPLGWYIEDGDDAQYSNEIIMLNGDLVIQSGGNLSFEGVTLYSNARGDKDQAIKIVVEEGGFFSVIGSEITATIQVDEHKGNQPVRYKFQIYGGANIQGSTISYMWGEVDGFMAPGTPLPGSISLTPQGGIEIFSDDVVIMDCIVTQGQASGVCIQEGSPTIMNTEFVDNGHHGLAIPASGSWSTIQNCDIHDNEYFGVYTRSGNITFRENFIYNNDWMGFIASYAGRIRIEDCEITGQRKGNWIIETHAEYFNCTIENDENFDLRLDSAVYVVNDHCDINGDAAIVLDNGSLCLCQFVEVEVYGDEGPVAGAEVVISGTDGNYTWTKEFLTDGDGMALGYAATVQRYSEEWHNMSEFRIAVHHGGKDVWVDRNITEEITVSLDVEDDNSGGNGGDVGSNDEEDYLPIIALVCVLVVVIFGVAARRRKQAMESGDDGRGEGEESMEPDPLEIEWDDTS